MGFFMNKISKKGAMFIAAHEGFVSKAYRDPVGVLTIGTGFTNRSKAFASYWIQKHGRRLKPKDVISRTENDAILCAIVDEEYGAAVNRDIAPDLTQNEHDGCCSVLFNLGPSAAKWRWAQAIKKGDIAKGCKLLANGYSKAGGRTLAGLVKRRRAEAVLIEKGIYQGLKQSITHTVDLEQYQAKLAQLGFDVGPIDGEDGILTQAAVLQFQRDHPHLVNDGILGRATAAAIDRALKANAVARKTAPALLGAGGVTLILDEIAQLAAWVQSATLLSILAMCGFLAWRYRDEIRHAVISLLNSRKADEVTL